MPGKADGGVYAVLPGGGDASVDQSMGKHREYGENIVMLTGDCPQENIPVLLVLCQIPGRGWFYHKAIWVVIPGGKRAVLTARVRKPLFGKGEGELVLLEMPQVGQPLAAHNLPWRENVLVEGPDVMFEVVDLDESDATIQVVCAEFFGRRLTMHSLSAGDPSEGIRPRVTESWVLDNKAGPAYSVRAVDLRGNSPGGRPTHLLVTTHECIYDTSPLSAVGGDVDTTTGAYSGYSSQGGGGSGEGGGGAWRGVVTGMAAGGGGRGEGEGESVGGGSSAGGGGALHAYEIPRDWRVYPRVYPSPGWRRTTLASGFRVRGLSINPGAPGFPYLFHPHRSLQVECRFFWLVQLKNLDACGV
ncbi:unnamed protein product [Discosporangium mesarthrocarpum]